MSNGIENKFTLITGASLGLGRAFAEVCAQKKRNLILTSLPGENLDQVSKSLTEKYAVKVLFYETDLTDITNIKSLLVFLQPYQINMLINNAAIGGTCGFADERSERVEKMLLLNINSLVMLTHHLIPKMTTQNKAYILNISSLAAFSPIPYKAVYSASKAFVYSFSRGLSEELRGTGIHLAVANPGGMPVNGDISETVQSSRFIRMSILTPHQIAAVCYQKLLNRETLIIPGRINRIGCFFQKILPVELQMKIFRNRFKKELKTIL